MKNFREVAKPAAVRRAAKEARPDSADLAYLKQVLEESTSQGYRDFLLHYMSATQCPACHGQRLRPERLAVKVNGVSIADFTRLPVSRSLDLARKMDSPDAKLRLRPRRARDRGTPAISERRWLGLYALDRSAATLSGVEGERIRLATQIGSKSKRCALRPRRALDRLAPPRYACLLKALEELRDLGNTVLVVEHDEETIRRADDAIDSAPEAGRHGGELVAHGTPEEIMEVPACSPSVYRASPDRDAARTADERRRNHHPGCPRK